MSNTHQIKRRLAGTGAPASLRSGELAVNMQEGIVYCGFGDDGTGVATSIARVGTLDPLAASIYDPERTGKVSRARQADEAGAVPWSGVADRPASFPPSAHHASLITAGTVDIARLPAALFAAPTVAPSTIASLTAAQQAEIVGGGCVVTSDGREWRYTGSGSKTSEANYREMADRTPDWSVIANRPTTRAGYGLTDVQALNDNLTQLAGLALAADRLPYAGPSGVMALAPFTAQGRSVVGAATREEQRIAMGVTSLATQPTDNVAITGGSLSGIKLSEITLDCGTL